MSTDGSGSIARSDGEVSTIINRRDFAGGIALIAGLNALPATASEKKLDVQSAFDFAFPIHAMLRTRQAALARGARLNQFNHRRSLSGPADRNVTTPNNDTLYSAAWLDLSGGPLILTIPDSPDRYHSVALLNLFTDNDAVLGTSSKGRSGSQILLCGAGWAGAIPAGTTRIDAKTNDAWLIARVLVDGANDLAAAREVQTGFTLAPLGTPGDSRPLIHLADDPTDPKSMLEVVNEALARSQPSRELATRIAGLARFGIAPGMRDSWAQLSPAARQLWLSRVHACYDELRGGLERGGSHRRGWAYPSPDIGTFRASDHYRACIALGGLGALPAAEAIYPSTRIDAREQPLDGGGVYRLQIPREVPARGFWSLSMYEIADDGRLFFTSNELGRYAIGDRTQGIVRDPDGSTTITMSHVRPDAQGSNWLPAPPGPFALTFRAYLPEAPFLNGQFQLPAVERSA